MSDHDHDHDAAIPRYVADMAARLSRLHCCACGGFIFAEVRRFGEEPHTVPMIQAGCSACAYWVSVLPPKTPVYSGQIERHILSELATAGARRRAMIDSPTPAWFRSLGIGSEDWS